jgi:hypothetical protein
VIQASGVVQRRIGENPVAVDLEKKARRIDVGDLDVHRKSRRSGSVAREWPLANRPQPLAEMARAATPGRRDIRRISRLEREKATATDHRGGRR